VKQEILNKPVTISNTEYIKNKYVQEWVNMQTDFSTSKKKSNLNIDYH